MIERGTPSKGATVTISVLLVDDHELIRQGLRRAFERDGDFEVAGEAGSLADARRLLSLLNPDVVILDVRLPDGNGLEACRKVRADNAEIGIVILTMYAGDDQLFEALEAGASAFVPKNAPAEDVVAAARHASSSPRSFTANDLNEAMKRKLSPSGPQLSPREREVLSLLADGLGVAQISRQLYISESTTKTHISKLYEKLGAGNRAQALMTALKLGLLKREESGL
jgi:DNA-binding NarL/FixJ family response regulator